MEAVKGKFEYISVLNVISCFAVVLLHSNGCFWQFSNGRYWFTANIIESVAYFAVPCFFMITSVTLLDFREKYDLKTYFIKRFRKTVLPFFVWSGIGLLYLLAFGRIDRTDLSLLYIFNGIMNTSIFSIYWFFIALFGIYLCLPLFAAVPKAERKQVFSYLVAVGFLVEVAIPFMITVSGFDIAWPLSVSVVAGALIYVPLGYLLHETELTEKQRYVIYVAALAGLLAHIIGTYVLSCQSGEIDRTFKGYENVPCILYSIGIFVFVKYAGRRFVTPYVFRKLVDAVAAYTFPVYLIHWYLLDIFVHILGIPSTSIFYRLGAPFVVFPVVIIFVWLLRKVPFLRKIVP